MDTNNVEKDILLTFEIYRHFYLQHISGWSKIRRLSFVVFYPILFFLSALTLKNADFEKEMISLMILIVLLGMSFIVLLIIGLRFALLKSKFESNKLIRESSHYIFKKDKLSISSPNSHSDVEWDKFYKVRESGRILALYISRTQALLIPKYLFSENELLVIKEFIAGIKTQKNPA